MHILIRRSSLLSTSHALAWQTTSRSAGFVNKERSQKVGGSFSNPIDMKKPSPYFTIPLASRFFFFSRSVRSKLLLPCLLYTSDAADERSSVDLGGRRIIKKK